MPAQLQCLRSGVWEPGNKAIQYMCITQGPSAKVCQLPVMIKGKPTLISVLTCMQAAILPYL